MGPSKEDEGAISMIKLQGFFFSFPYIQYQIKSRISKRNVKRDRLLNVNFNSI